ncbi:UNVERIFIED_CONTAM: hypothetical protein PYX00_006649 [Menopon gallinae]|uniref:C3H1-type domain-containing protein n=1 Tax=Menopon gallinae TaxID=328185 RepID=A0AAW2HXQ0_9NEOP
MGLTPGQPLVAGQVPAAVATNPYLTGMPQVGNTFNPFFTPGPMMPAIVGPDPAVDRLEVCREFVRGACKRPEGECRFAHPPEAVTANEDGTVTVCMDAVKGRCTRDPCRYFHPPLHLQAHIKAAQSRVTATLALPPGPAPGPVGPVELGRKRAREPCDDVLLMDMKSSVGSFYYESFAFPGMVPYKRPAADKSGVPVYQPGATYQQLMQLQQPFVPVSCEYTATTHVPSPSEGKSETEERPGIGPIPDAAARAKEVATQSYAKAKLAAAALNYTGVSLNKQTPPAAPLPRGYPYTFSAQTYQIPYAKPPPPVNPYAFLRPTYTVPPPATPSNPVLVGNHLLVGSMLSHYPTAAPTAAATTTTTTHENNNTSPQPYKKMKTT